MTTADVAARLAAHSVDYPRFIAEGAALGCGRLHGEGPRTEAQALYVEQYEAWIASGVRAQWEAERDALVAERDRLIDAAAPAKVAADEPTDLLQLLALVGAG